MEMQQNITVKAVSATRKIMYVMSKRLIDIVVSGVLLILLSPFFLVIGIMIYKKDGFPLLFKQAYVGKHNRSIIIWKFRTTTVPSKVIRALPPHPFPDKWIEGVPHEFNYKTNTTATVTKFGARLREHHFDRFPQLVNVLKGDMSLVGPKPEIPEIAYFYNDKQIKRLDMKPGMTGYAQINGKSNRNHGQKLVYDLYYIQNCSLRLDMKIFFRAISRVIKK